MLVDRCPGCSKPVAEADTACPHCARDFTAPAARKAAAWLEPEPEPAAARVADDVPAPRLPVPDVAEEAPAKPAAKERPRLEAEAPASGPEPSLSPPFAVDSPQAYVPGTYSAPEESYKPAKAAPRPPWQWLAMAVVCVVALKFYGGRGPKLPLPDDAKAPPAAADAQPAAPVAVPGNIAGAAAALTDAKDAAAAASAAAPPTTATVAGPPAKPGRKAPPARRKAPEPAYPDEDAPAPDDASVVISAPDAEEPPRRKAAAAASNEWRMRGAIFDLLTTDPVKGADVVFMDAKTGRRFATGTDAQGRFRATLPVSDAGYDLAIRHPRYEPKYFEDGVPSYRTQGPEQRQSAAADLLRILQTKEMIVGVGGAVIEKDFILIPVAGPR